ncbi:MAG: hypothetical protein QNJ75_05535 [Acidimicrobiia bacterium]|nr:hypothetical protein [Acidimicrobiia bacterium]
MPIFRKRTKRSDSTPEPVEIHPDHDFRVVDHEIFIDFAVPLASEGADEVLTELLKHHAVEIIKDRKRRGQPLEGIPLARVSARRSGEPHEVGVIELDKSIERIDIEIPDLVPQPQMAGYDPLAKFDEGLQERATPSTDGRTDELAPLGEQLRLTAGVAAGLRSFGVDPEQMTATDLGLGLLRLSGYQVTETRDGYRAEGHDATIHVVIVDHEPGDHPELTEKAVTSFLVGFAGARTQRAMLITDKYGPYMIYQKERANPKAVFVTRERLQGFVDAVAVDR